MLLVQALRIWNTQGALIKSSKHDLEYKKLPNIDLMKNMFSFLYFAKPKTCITSNWIYIKLMTWGKDKNDYYIDILLKFKKISTCNPMRPWLFSEINLWIISSSYILLNNHRNFHYSWKKWINCSNLYFHPMFDCLISNTSVNYRSQSLSFLVQIITNHNLEVMC